MSLSSPGPPSRARGAHLRSCTAATTPSPSRRHRPRRQRVAGSAPSSRSGRPLTVDGLDTPAASLACSRHRHGASTDHPRCAPARSSTARSGLPAQDAGNTVKGTSSRRPAAATRTRRAAIALRTACSAPIARCSPTPHAELAGVTTSFLRDALGGHVVRRHPDRRRARDLSGSRRSPTPSTGEADRALLGG